ncbi:MAG: hypothetical protein ACTSYM_07540 [Candidatus Baldrarchaeia archaeon]
MVEEEKLEVPQKYLDLLPDPIKYASNDNTIVQLRNSLLWLFYLYDLPKEERDKIIQELLKIDYLTKLNLNKNFDPIGIFLYFQPGYKEIILSIKKVLKRIEQYKITHSGLIITSLQSAWVQPYTLNENEYKLLVEIIKNPKGSFREWSRETKISLAGVKYAFDRLKEKLLLRIRSQINFNAIKLNYFLVYVKNIYNTELKKMIGDTFLKKPWCRSVCWFASDPNSLFASLTIPSYTRCYNTFLSGVKALEEITPVEIYEIKEFFSSYNLTSYDPKSGWNFSPSTWTMFSFSEKSSDYLEYLKEVSSIHRVSYMKLPNFSFSKGDLYIIAALSRDYRIKSTILSQITGYSLPTISKKKKEFVERGILYPLPHIGNIGLLSSFALLWKGDIEDLEYLIYISAGLPYVVGYRMEQIYPTTGNFLLLFIWLPGTVSWNFIHNFSELGREIGLQKVLYEYKGSYSYTIDRFIYRWDEDKRKWRWNKNDLVFL